MRIRFRAASPFWALLVVFIIVVTAIAILFFGNFMENKKAGLLKAIEYLKSEYTFAQIKVSQKAGDRIGFNLSLFNMDGVKVADRDYDLRGNDVFLESKVVVVRADEKESAFVFPVKVYSDAIAPKDGTDITPLYLDGGYPSLYDSADISFRKTVLLIFNTVMDASKTEQDLKGVFDDKDVKISLDMEAVLHQSFLKGFRAGAAYRCVLQPGGGLQLLEVK